MADRDVTVDIIANDKTSRAVLAAERNMERLSRKSKDTNSNLKKDAKKAESVFTALFGSTVEKAKKAGILAGDETVDGFSSAFKALPPEIKAGLAGALVAGAIAAAPVVVAAVDSALLLGLGAGGLAAGIALAAQDSQVRSAFETLGTDVQDRLRQAALPFKSELIGAAGDFEKSFDKVAPSIDRIFQGLATTIRPLAQGFGKALENAMPGLERAFAASLPLLKDLAAWLPKLGEEVGKFADAMADAGPEAQLFFRFVLGFIDQTLSALTKLFEGTAALGRLLGVTSAEAHRLGDAASASGDSFDVYDEATSSLEGMMSAIQKTTASADTLAGAMTDRLVGSMLDLDHANLSVQESLQSVKAAFQENGRQLDIHTAKGQANRESVLGAVQSNLSLYDSLIRSGASAEDAAAAYNQNTAALEAQLRKAGLTKQQIDGLIGKYRDVPDEVNTNIVMQGLTDAIAGLDRTLRLINGIPEEKIVHVTTVFTEKGRASGSSRYGAGNDFAELTSWGPAATARELSEQFVAGNNFAGNDYSTGGRTIPPYDVRSAVDITNNLFIDGAPIRAIARSEARQEQRRDDWKAARR